MTADIYHEKQKKLLCALHALNNVLQEQAFTQEDLDKICDELDPNSWINAHRSFFGWGNYDINVIMLALQQKNYQVIWFDKRKDPSELNFGNIYGFITNIREHWVAIRDLPSPTEKDAGTSNYYNLDSKLYNPQSIGSTDSLIEYLRSKLKSPQSELLLVVTDEVGRVETWRRNPPLRPSFSNTWQAASTASDSNTLNPKVYGKENHIIGQSNTEFMVCGHRNKIVANHTENLKVLGNSNQVSAIRTLNVSVQGNDHQVSMQDITIQHILKKAPPSVNSGILLSAPANLMEFRGVRVDWTVVADIMCSAPVTRYYCSAAGEEAPHKPENVQHKATLAEELKSICDKFFENKAMECTAKMPQVQIRYVDQAHINQEDYIIGFFHLKVTELSLVHRQNDPIRVKILTDKLDAGSYSFTLLPSRDLVLFTGSLNGKTQLLSLIGNRITENGDNSFYVFFGPIEEVQPVPIPSNEEGGDVDIYETDMD